MTVRLTHIGGPTLLIEAHGWRILVDPTFDPPGRTYGFGLGTRSTKLMGPAIEVDQLPPIDLVLLTHDHHADNLDHVGRALLPRARRVISTPAAARRLRDLAVTGLAPWEETVVECEGRRPLRISATPCRHGPPLSRAVVGDVVGFFVASPEPGQGGLWITGDTVWIPALREVSKRFDIDTIVMHLGRVRFGVTGAVQYSMSARDALMLLDLVEPRKAVPVHYDGWSHFSEPVAEVQRILGDAAKHESRIVWLGPGHPTDV